MTLTSQLSDAASPVRRRLDAELPELAAVAAEVRHRLVGADVMACPPGVAPDVAGHALGASMVVTLGGRLPLPPMVPTAFAVVRELAVDSGGDADRAARRAVLAGLADRWFRHGDDNDPALAPLWATQLDAALAAVDDRLAEHVAAVNAHVAPALVPLTGTGPVVAAPTFAASAAVGGADGDVVCGTTLVELKAVARPALRHVRQLVGYALLDTDDQWTLEEVAIVYLRHGRTVSFGLDEVLALAGATRGLADLRVALAADLSAG